MATILALSAVAASAQRAMPAKSGVLAYIEGKVYVDGQLIEASATPFPMKASSIVSTEEGRAEVLLTGGTRLFLGEHSSVREIDNRAYNFSRLEMLAGSAVVITGDAGGMMDCEDSVTLSDIGVYRFDFRPLTPTENVCRFKVYEGAASVKLATVIAVLTSGKTMGVNHRCGDMIPTQEFNIGERDNLDNWSRERVRLRRAQ